VAAFHGTEFGIGIEVDGIDLGQRDEAGLMQAFGRTFYQRVGIVVTTGDDDGILPAAVMTRISGSTASSIVCTAWR